jgi:hypothetical protein
MYDEESINSRINIIYDYMYAKNEASCYIPNDILPGYITIDDIKYKKSYDNISFYINDIINNDITKLDYYDDIYFFKIKTDTHTILSKISFYKTLYEINSYDNPYNIDCLLSYLFGSLIFLNKTRHILLSLVNIDVDFIEIEKLFSNTEIQKIKENISSKIITSTCSIRIREYFFNCITLTEYLSKNNEINIKLLLFQVIHTLALLQMEYKFQHNNLTTDNIYIYRKKINTSIEYLGFYNDTFTIKDSSFDIKIANFEKSFIPNYYGKTKIQNLYYDVYTFLLDVWNILNKKNIINKESSIFFDKYLPDYIRNEKIDICNLQFIASPLDILYDKYFDIYKNSQLTLMDINSTRILKEDIDNDIYKSEGGTIFYKNKLIRKYFMKGGLYKSETSGYAQVNNDPFITNQHKRSIEKRFEETNPNDNGKGSRKGTGKGKGSDERERNSDEREKNSDERERNSDDRERNSDDRNKGKGKGKGKGKSEDLPSYSQYPSSFIPAYSDYNQQSIYGNPSYGNPSYGNPSYGNPSYPIQKIYNINTTNPLGSYTTINKVYEDILPGEPNIFTYLTVYERQQLINYLRNNLLSYNDGEDINTKGTENLLSYMKVMDINPYNNNNNPIKDLPRNFLLYRSAYPIRFDTRTRSIDIAKSAIGINIRIYMMSEGDMKCKTINNLIDADSFDIWREIKYYDWIKTEVIKRKISPNFIAPILYKIDTKSKYNWDELEIIKSNKDPANILLNLKKNQKKINKMHKMIQFSKFANKYVETDLTNEIKYSLVLLTEAPNSTILQWASPKYESYGSVKKMIISGYHTPDIWYSILFQLVYACAVLQKKKIYINNFSLEKNVYIKDIYYDPLSIGSWIYRHNNIDYYIPNYGYILMIDTKFTDINVFDSLIKKDDTDNKEFKIYGSLYEKNNIYENDDQLLDNHIIKNFKDCIDPDVYTYQFKIKNGVQPDESIINLLRKMYLDTETKIENYLFKYFQQFLHNRLGTKLYKTEYDNLMMNGEVQIVPRHEDIGNLVAYSTGNKEFEWVLYIKHVDGNKGRILIKKVESFIEYNVNIHNLFVYPFYEKIKPESRKNMKFDENYIYESYNLNNI